jgi:hypothetical protein
MLALANTTYQKEKATEVTPRHISDIWLLLVDAYRNVWTAESAEITGLLSGLAEVGSFVPAT